MNTPFQFGKQTASHLGGTRDPMVVAWPKRITADRTMRTQFTHVIDIGPTILEAGRHPRAHAPSTGSARSRWTAPASSYSFDDADAPERHTQQYFEMFGARAMYKDGWWSASRPDALPWDVSPATLAPVRSRGRLGSRPRRRLGALRPHH